MHIVNKLCELIEATIANTRHENFTLNSQQIALIEHMGRHSSKMEGVFLQMLGEAASLRVSAVDVSEDTKYFTAKLTLHYVAELVRVEMNICAFIAPEVFTDESLFVERIYMHDEKSDKVLSIYVNNPRGSDDRPYLYKSEGERSCRDMNRMLENLADYRYFSPGAQRALHRFQQSLRHY